VHATNLNPTAEAATRWGLPAEAVRTLGGRLQSCWERYQSCFRTRTRDTSVYAFHYLSGQLRLETGRTFAHLARVAGVAEQNLQHFMSQSPWRAQTVYRQVQAELAALPDLDPAQGVLLLDESAVERAGTGSVGAARQHNGRLGKIEVSQVGVFLAYVHGSLWTWVEGELFLPEHWFSPAWEARRQQVGVPTDRRFATKIELGWQLIQRVAAGPLTFAAVVADALYGASEWLRAQLDWAGLPYLLDVPADTRVYLTAPEAVARQVKQGPQRRAPPDRVVRWAGETYRVETVAQRPETAWQRVRVRVRTTERGYLEDEFAALPVWTEREGILTAEVLVLRREGNGRVSYALGNLPPDTPLSRLAGLKCQRYFVERAIQDAKSEAGWDELAAQKYRAWEHHLALTVLASWFVAETKWEWSRQYARDPALLEQFEVEVLPALSMANVRTLLRATLPLPQLSVEAATAQVVQHLVKPDPGKEQPSPVSTQ
jgi:SRSO17 transposase